MTKVRFNRFTDRDHPRMRSLGWLKIRTISRFLVFMAGVCSGIMFSVFLFSIFRQSRSLITEQSLRAQDYTLEAVTDLDVLKETLSANETFQRGKDEIADKLKKHVRVLCLVITSENTYKKNTEAVKNTWGKRCNTLLFVGNFEDINVPVLRVVGAQSGNAQSWALMKAALRHVYANYLETHDWVLRTDDDTFVVLENLRYILSQYNPSDSLYLGCRLKKHVKQGFMSAGAGYVMSSGAVVRFLRDGLSKEICSPDDNSIEDVEIGRCMEGLNVTFVDTRDSLHRGRFFPMSPESHIIPDVIPKDSWYWDTVYYPANTGLNCCSDTAVSFHDINAEHMFVMNYLIYHLRPYGISSHSPINSTNIYIVIK